MSRAVTPHNILHVLGTARIEGAGIPRLVAALARGLNPERYRLHAWFLIEGGPLIDELQSLGIPAHLVEAHSFRRPQTLFRFCHALQRENVAILHQHLGGRAMRLVARFVGGARILMHVHSRAIESSSFHPVPIPTLGADAVIAASHAVAKCVVGREPRVVYPGVPVPQEDAPGVGIPRRSTGIVVGTATRLYPIKGVVYLVRAMALVRRDIPEARLEIAGSGPEQGNIQDEVQRLGLQDCVRFLGWQKDLAPAFTGWDVFVLPSMEEGAPIAILDAMAAGLPVVSTSVGGISELVEEGQTGYLVPPANPEALAQRLNLLLRHPEQRHRMGLAARARVRERFSAERMVQAIASIYDELLGLA